MSQKTVRLRRVDLEVYQHFSDAGIERQRFAALRNQADVLSWHIWRWLRGVQVFAPATRFVVVASTSEPLGQSSTDAIIRVRPNPAFDIDSDPLRKRNLDAMHSLLYGASEAASAIDWSWLTACLDDFACAGHTAQFVRAKRKLRGTDIEFRLLEQVTCQSACMEFVTLRAGREVHRERVSDIAILPATWSGCLNQIVVDEKTVAIEGRVPTSVAPEDLNNSEKRDTPRRLNHYDWSRPLTEVGAS